MDTWKITPLNLGTLQVTSGAQVYKHGVRQNVGEVLTVPCIGWLLQNDSTGEKRMLVLPRMTNGGVRIIIPLRLKRNKN